VPRERLYSEQLGREVGAPSAGGWQRGAGAPVPIQRYERKFEGAEELNRPRTYRNWVARSAAILRDSDKITPAQYRYAMSILFTPPGGASDDCCSAMYASVATKAQWAGVSEATAREHEKALVAVGLLRKWHRPAQRNAQTGTFVPRTALVQFDALPEVIEAAKTARRKTIEQKKNAQPYRGRTTRRLSRADAPVTPGRADPDECIEAALSVAVFDDGDSQAVPAHLAGRLERLMASARGRDRGPGREPPD